MKKPNNTIKLIKGETKRIKDHEGNGRDKPIRARAKQKSIKERGKGNTKCTSSWSGVVRVSPAGVAEATMFCTTAS